MARYEAAHASHVQALESARNPFDNLTYKGGA